MSNPTETNRPVNLKRLPYSPHENPLIKTQVVPLRRGLARSSGYQDLVNPDTGSPEAVSVIHRIEDKDEAQFVKVFAEGVARAYELNRTAQRVFTLVLDAYERSPMTGGYSDAVELFWFGDGLDGRDVGLSAKTFQRGLKDLLAKGFLHPRTPNTYWVNPHLFFKGSRVMLVMEYRRKTAEKVSMDLPPSILEGDVPH